ncbi:MAG: hypothetical protein A3J27_13190 [Candidatus Tectomicrobia bacterium RIFCSPLOWO2_12_FULL_69_37]|nr:MAG: hypothetical protein A3J27_13190 [Candidatus Tectomicrobia bacterium RIFCSPLOWO2_12_FULL_69_37]OGL64858.1 MAG: hypothetical protein A3I72_02665 [Candidatus Tectomicrobia bacterium RIFCSPLOWO2_02_FULL_70_19]
MQSGQMPGAIDEISRLKAEHHELDEKLSRLESVRFPTPEEELAIKALKKQKLALKDRMQHLAKA